MDADGRTPLDVCNPTFREELEDLWQAARDSKSSSRMLRPKLLSGAHASILRARYHLIGEVTSVLLLAEDLHTHAQVAIKLLLSPPPRLLLLPTSFLLTPPYSSLSPHQVALKLSPSKEKMDHEASVLQMVPTRSGAQTRGLATRSLRSPLDPSLLAVCQLSL